MAKPLLQYNEAVAAEGGTSTNRQTGAITTAPVMPTVATPPSTTAIPMDQLGGTTQAIKLPSVSTDTAQADGMVAGADASVKTTEQRLKEATPPETEASKQAKSLFGDINALLPTTTNKATDQLAAEKQQGLPDLKTKLADVNALITSRLAEYNKQIAGADLAPGETPLPIVRGRQAVIQRNQASDIGLLQARALGLQGQVDIAQETANRAIDLKYDTLEDTINVKMKQLELLNPILDREELRFAKVLEQKYTEEREALAEKKAKAKENIALAIESGLTTKFVNKNGEFFRTSDGKTYDNIEEFFQDAGVKSFEEAYQRGMVGDFNPDLSLNRSIIADLMTKYPDAGITLRDTPETAQSKLRGSRIYGEQVRPPGGSGGGSGGGILGLSNQQIDNISPLVTQFQNSPIVQNYNTIGEGYSFAKSISNTTTNPADDQALIYALAKALDPGSVVREGEYATVQKYAQSMAQSYGKNVTQAINGTGFLSETARANIKATIQSRFQAAETSYKNLYGETERRVNLIGNTDKGSQLLNNYGGAFAPTSSTIGPTNPAPVQAVEQKPEGFQQKLINFLWGND